MDYHEAIERLSNHANMPMGDNLAPDESFVFNLWQSNKDGIFRDVEQLKNDVITCIEIINNCINYSINSTTANRRIFDIELILSVSAIILSTQEYALIWQKRSLFNEDRILELWLYSWEISQAWCAVLHGDIESIGSEILLQRQVKGLL